MFNRLCVVLWSRSARGSGLQEGASLPEFVTFLARRFPRAFTSQESMEASVAVSADLVLLFQPGYSMNWSCFGWEVTAEGAGSNNSSPMFTPEPHLHSKPFMD